MKKKTSTFKIFLEEVAREVEVAVVGHGFTKGCHPRNVPSEVATMVGGMPPDVATSDGGCGGGVPQKKAKISILMSCRVGSVV